MIGSTGTDRPFSTHMSVEKGQVRTGDAGDIPCRRSPRNRRQVVARHELAGEPAGADLVDEGFVPVDRWWDEVRQHEPADAVLSDDAIVALLRQEGVDIARRTVAKYREALHIPSSVQRKREKAVPA